MGKNEGREEGKHFDPQFLVGILTALIITALVVRNIAVLVVQLL